MPAIRAPRVLANVTTGWDFNSPWLIHLIKATTATHKGWVIETSWANVSHLWKGIFLFTTQKGPLKLNWDPQSFQLTLLHHSDNSPTCPPEFFLPLVDIFAPATSYDVLYRQLKFFPSGKNSIDLFWYLLLVFFFLRLECKSHLSPFYKIQRKC